MNDLARTEFETERFAEAVIAAYRALLDLLADAEVGWKLGRYANGTIQITLSVHSAGTSP